LWHDTNKQENLTFQTTAGPKSCLKCQLLLARGLLQQILIQECTHPSGVLKMHSAFSYIKQEPLGGERKKNVQFHIVHQLPRGKESKKLHMGS
jgi:hypothetical protein